MPVEATTRRVCIAGATGSVGSQAADVIEQCRAETIQLTACGISAGSRWTEAAALARRLASRALLVHDPVARRQAAAVLGAADDLHLVESVGELLDASEPQLVLNSVVGFAGLHVTVAALERGIDVALANKESLVAAGDLVMALAQERGARVLPVDSEHSALLQCMGSSTAAEIESLVLTASGGPFRGYTRQQLARVSVDQALDHPTWTMGGKISIDSATLMNKGLELIEAQVLFGVPPERIEVVVHPTSIVHSLVRHRDGSLLAHLGWPDMRVPIAYALHYPVRPHVPAQRLELAEMRDIEFHEPDVEVFRCLQLARDAAEHGGAAPCVLNAANEVAVAAFTSGTADFLQIAEIVESTLDKLAAESAPRSFAEVAELDARARETASRMPVGR